MKPLKVLISVILLTTLGASLSAQTKNNSQAPGTKTEIFKVWGKCESCKARIETAVKAEGATSASWDQETKMLTVSYDPSKTSIDAMQKKVASVGHDTEKYKASKDVYDKLPSCCHYERSQM
jgi:mercuric ion binding protein